MTPMIDPTSLDGIVHQITTSNNPVALNHTLRNALPKESRDTILASTLPGGQDPLTVLDPHVNTLGVLYILSARLHVPGSALPPWPIVLSFCQVFDPELARLAPDRVTLLARGIVRYAEHLNNSALAIEPLSFLLQRYPPDLSYLTTLHSIFLVTCTSTRHFTAALPVLSVPIANIDTSLSDLHYTDSITYHYAGGVALAALRRWRAAEEFFEIAAASPGQVPSALQLEALKKLKLVQLISTGQTSSLPKYIHPLLIRLFKNSPYNSLVNAYPHKTETLREIYEEAKKHFAAEKNLGLVQLALDRAPRWALKKLTATYVTLGLADIARAVKVESEDHARDLVLSMIESDDVSAQISADGTVTFSDPPPRFTKEKVDRALGDAQSQAARLAELDMELARSKEFLNKAMKGREDAGSSWVTAGGEEDIAYGMTGGSWTDETLFS